MGAKINRIDMEIITIRNKVTNEYSVVTDKKDEDVYKELSLLHHYGDERDIYYKRNTYQYIYPKGDRVEKAISYTIRANKEDWTLIPEEILKHYRVTYPGVSVLCPRCKRVVALMSDWQPYAYDTKNWEIVYQNICPECSRILYSRESWFK